VGVRAHWEPRLRSRPGRAGAGALALACCLALAACGGGARAAGGQAQPATTSTLSSPATTGTTATTAAPSTTARAAAAGCRLPSLEFQVSQLLLVGFWGATATRRSAGLVQRDVGGLVLFRRNIRSLPQLRRLLDQLQARADVPLEIAVDEEPGRVARLAGLIPGAPSARELGRLPTSTVYAYGLRIGRGLAGAGITTDLAPVLDVTGAGRLSVIGDRSFGDDPDTVSRAGIAFEKGLTAGGVTTVGKHFPGHGRTTIDSHRVLPVVDVSVSRLTTWDLRPFARAVDHGLPGVMVGHLLIRRLDPRLPASLSPAVVGRLLRGQLGFRGLAVTDALEMGAIQASWDLPTAAELAVRAGIDQVLISERDDLVPAVVDRLTDAVEAGRLSRARVREAFLRVERFKGQHRWDRCADQ
jgi:beta-N-acetylhexosaminidase